MPKQRRVEAHPRPLCVDLDGTLVRTDLLIESVFALLKQNILFLILLPLWLLKGKHHLKQQIADRVELDVGLLPYHEPFVDYLKQQRAAGRRLILATASNLKFAKAVADHLGLFDDVLASDEQTNLSGRQKLERLRSRFGDGNFDYAGNARADVPIWAHAGEVILVNPERGVRAAVERGGRTALIFDGGTGKFTLYLKAMRLEHWLKNILVFVPLALAHQFHDPESLVRAGLAFLAFGLCASSVYLLNDLLDLPADREHPTKRHRPFAAGRISILYGTALIPGLLAASIAVAFLLPLEFVWVLGFYYVMTLAYSLRLKRAALVDVLVLAGLYTLRIIAGAAAVSVVLSFWLLAFSLFLFLSLALVKRYTELLALPEQGRDRAAGRGYYTVDLETLAHFGSSSAFMAVLVLAFYINSDAVKALYTRPEVLWLLCPLLIYLVSRIWLLARRNDLHQDPMVFAIRDRRSQWLVGVGGFLLWAAAWI